MSNEISFENKLNRLQEVVDLLEKDEPNLDNSLKLYEEGIKLYRECINTLEEAKHKVLILREGITVEDIGENQVVVNAEDQDETDKKIKGKSKKKSKKEGKGDISFNLFKEFE